MVNKEVEDNLLAPLDDFKEREREIIGLMAKGLSNQDIADELFITKGTVRWYNKQIYSKLGTSRRTEAIALARKMGLIDTGEAPTPSVQRQYKLPITTGPFIGRDDEIDEINQLLAKPDVRLLSLIAAGGMGKSRLSLEVGHEVKSDYEHGVAFVDLTPLRNPDDIPQHTVTSLGLSISDKQSPEDVLFNYCREKELLLIFDNFEHILSGARFLSDILEAASKVNIIATSRERLNLRVETTYHLQPVSQQGDLLFIEVATMMKPDFVIEGDDLLDVQRIVELVGGSPLALTLAATWVDILSLVEIAEEITASLDILSSDMGDMPERQRSIHSVIDPTWKRLTEKEQKAFMWASVFRGGFTRETFQQVTGASIRTLQTLLNRSLISHGYGRRYDMHPLLRQFAREKLEVNQMRVEAKNKHLQVLRQYAEHHAERMFSGHYLESLDALELEADNVRAALDWTLQGQQIEEGVALILANGEFWRTRSKALEALSYVERAIKQATHPMLHYWKSIYSDRLGQVEHSIEAARWLIDYGETNQDDEMLAYGQLCLGYRQNSKVAKPLFESALANAQKVDNQSLIAACLTVLDLVQPNESCTTIPMIQQALEIYESRGDLYGVSRVVNNLAIRYYDDPEHREEARGLMETSLQLKRKIGDRAGEARRLTTLSMWALEEEELELARNWLTEGRAICEELGELDRLSYVLTIEGLLYLMTTDFEQAQAKFERSLDISIRIDDRWGIVDLHAFLCSVHLLQKKLDKARRAIHEAIKAAKQINQQYDGLIIASANYLWHKHDLSTCVPLLAFVAKRDLNIYSGSEVLINKYILQPLIYQVQQKIGEAAWQGAITKSQDTTIEQVFADIEQTLQI